MDLEYNWSTNLVPVSTACTFQLIPYIKITDGIGGTPFSRLCRVIKSVFASASAAEDLEEAPAAGHHAGHSCCKRLSLVKSL